MGDCRFRLSITLVVIVALFAIPFGVTEAEAQQGGGSGLPQVEYELNDEGSGTISLDGSTLTITNLSMVADDSPAISVLSGSVTLNLVGESNITGGSGYAGIYVAPGATLIIDSLSDGTLTVYGGDGSATVGAGIGGNGAKDDISGSEDFGAIVIEGGTVYAYGGDSSNNRSGGAAGIGSGSNLFDAYSEVRYSGSVAIYGGTVYAYGGSYPENNGGAGIGTGTSSNGIESEVSVIINGGKVVAEGGNRGDAAGIGGGFGTSGGYIEINGGNISATGTSSGYGCGSGIGGCDVSSAEIKITGGMIYANSLYGFSIGSGYNCLDLGIISELTMSGGTVVTGIHSSYNSILASMTITGGSLDTGNVYKATDGIDDVYCVELVFNDIAEGIAVESIGIDGYGMTDVFTDSLGKIYVWLPAGTVIGSATANGTPYSPYMPYVVTADGDNIVELSPALFFNIAVDTIGAGTATVSPANQVQPGTEVYISFNPDSGYGIARIDGPGTYNNESGIYSFVMPNSDVTVTVIFEPLTYTVTFNIMGQIDQVEAEYGSPVPFPSDPTIEGYRFIGWDVPADSIVTGDMTVTAMFEALADPEGPQDSGDWHPPYVPDDDPYIPPNVVYREGDNGGDVWIFVVLGSVATFLFLIFFWFERRRDE